MRGWGGLMLVGVAWLMGVVSAVAQDRPAELSDVAAREIVRTYDAKSGQWLDVNWWQTANTLTALIDHMQASGDRTALPLVIDSFAKNRSWEFGDYKGDSTDDTAWWALALVDMYDLTHDRAYLDTAREDEAYIYGYWDGTCGGGVWWDIQRRYKNAISNELYLTLAAALHNRIPGDTVYLARAERTWDWLRRSGMINAGNLVNDGLKADGKVCRNNGGETYTYNQGVILGGLAELTIADRDPAALEAARRIARAVTGSQHLAPGGILREPCEPAGCGLDGTSFKGVFVRNLERLDQALAGHPFALWLRAQAASVASYDRSGDRFGLSWAGPFISPGTGAQHSALDLFTAAR